MSPYISLQASVAQLDALRTGDQVAVSTLLGLATFFHGD